MLSAFPLISGIVTPVKKMSLPPNSLWLRESCVIHHERTSLIDRYSSPIRRFHNVNRTEQNARSSPLRGDLEQQESCRAGRAGSSELRFSHLRTDALRPGRL